MPFVTTKCSSANGDSAEPLSSALPSVGFSLLCMERARDSVECQRRQSAAVYAALKRMRAMPHTFGIAWPLFRRRQEAAESSAPSAEATRLLRQRWLCDWTSYRWSLPRGWPACDRSLSGGEASHGAVRATSDLMGKRLTSVFDPVFVFAFAS